jgi:hypothetical protein
MKAVGIRYDLPSGVTAELYKNGAVTLKWEEITEQHDSFGQLVDTTDKRCSLRRFLGNPKSLVMYIMQCGRPHGTIWEKGANDGNATRT